MTEPLLVVDDEPDTLSSVRRTLRTDGFDHVVAAASGREALDLVQQQPFSLVLLDLIMPEVGGEDVLRWVAEHKPALPVVVVTAEQEVATAVRCMKSGATDYLVKPFGPEQLLHVVRKTLESSALRFECERLRDALLDEERELPEPFARILTSDPQMLRVFACVEAISRGSRPVLITGETGTGKDMLARALHEVSGRSGRFVAVNVAGLDDTMFSDTLFGHRPGSFTGAAGARHGLIEEAAEGTLFLDEIGELSEASQVKLLRLLQEGEYYPLGADKPEQLRARVVAATNGDPTELRADLFYRLSAYNVRVPPLRDRACDLPVLVDFFLDAAAEDLRKPRPTLPNELFTYLSNYDFPGNVRELQSLVFDAVARHEHGVMSMQPFLEHMGERESVRPPAGDAIIFPNALPALRDIEAAAVREALQRVDGNQTAAARMLGVSRPTIGRHVKRQSQPTDGVVS